MCYPYYHQGDILFFDFSPSVDNEIRGIRPAVIISSDRQNAISNYLTVVPITRHGTNFGGYIDLIGYKNVTGRANVAQTHCYSIDRVRSEPIDMLRVGDFKKIQRYLFEMVGG